jgi:hypothetical protein
MELKKTPDACGPTYGPSKIKYDRTSSEYWPAVRRT